MAVILSELRVTAGMDASGFTAGADAIDSANKRIADSGQTAGAALAAQDAAAGRSGGTMVSLSKSYIDGYAGVAKFSQQVNQLQTQFELGNVSADRASQIYTGLIGKFQLYANAVDIATKGNRDFASIIDQINGTASVHIDMLSRETAATLQLTQAQQAQNTINGNLGVLPSGSGAGSAQSSADAFMADTGGLAGVAQARGAQTAQAFTDELDSRLIAGTGKSARDSASVFQSEFTQLDEISRLRAEQTGQVFTDDLNSRLITGIRKSAKDSAATFQSEFDRLDQVAQLKAQQVGQNFQQDLNARLGIGAIPKSARDSASAFQELSGEAEIAGESINGFGATAAFGNTQSMALTAALRHMFDAMVAGRPPLQALFMETGNLTYGLSGAGGFAGAIKSVGSSIGSFLISPVGMAVAAIAVLASAIGAVVIAGASWASQQRAVALALTGAGGASDATVKGINDMAEAMAGAARLSVSEATKLATALAGTGKVGMDMIGRLIGMSKDFAVTFGKTNADAAQMLAKAFSDPAKGAEELNARLAILNPAMQQHIKNLMDSNRVGEAQKILADAVNTQLASATNVTSNWSQSWTSLTNAISTFWTSLGKGIDAVTGNSNIAIEDRYHAAQAQVALLTGQLTAAQKYAAQATAIGATSSSSDNFTRQVELLKVELQAAETAAENYSAAMERGANASGIAKDNIAAMLQKQTVAKFFPDMPSVGGPTAPGSVATDVKNAQDIANSTVEQQKQNLTQKDANSLLLRATEVQKSWIDDQEKIIQLDNLKRQSVDALAPGQRAYIAGEQERIRLSGDAGKLMDENAKKQAIATAMYQASGGVREALAQEREHITLLGQTATITQVVTGKVDALKEANLRLDPAYKITDAEIARLKNMYTAQEEGFRLQEKITVGIATEDQIRKVLDNDEAIFISRRRVLEAGSEADQANYAIAREKRFKTMMEQNAVAGSRFPQFTKASIDAQDFTKQLDTLAVSGVDHLADSIVSLNTKTMSLGDTFKALGVVVINELEKMIIKMTLFQALGNGTSGGGGLLGGILGLFGKGGGTSVGGSSVAGSVSGSVGVSGLQSGGMVGVDGTLRYVHPAYFENAPRMATGGMITDGGVPIIAHPGERVLNRQQTAAYNAGGSSGQTFVTNVTVTGSDITKAQVEALVTQSHKRLAKDINSSLPDRVAAINRDPRRR